MKIPEQFEHARRSRSQLMRRERAIRSEKTATANSTANRVTQLPTVNCQLPTSPDVDPPGAPAVRECEQLFLPATSCHCRRSSRCRPTRPRQTAWSGRSGESALTRVRPPMLPGPSAGLVEPRRPRGEHVVSGFSWMDTGTVRRQGQQQAADGQRDRHKPPGTSGTHGTQIFPHVV